MPLPSGNPGVYIVLAAYNGERFLQEQIDSIREQTFRDWRLLIRDDGSTDGTAALVRAAAEDDPRIDVLPAGPVPPVGAAGNFSALLEAARDAGAQLCFLADQDDIWRPDKLQVLLGHFPQFGREDEPVLVHSDLELVDERGTILSRSFFQYRGILAEPDYPLNQLLSINYVTGCSVCINRSLLELATPLPPEAIMHDWWLALVAAGSGRIQFEAEPLLSYRQHDQNVIGAQGEAATIRELPRWRESWARGNLEFGDTFVQVNAVLARLESKQRLVKDVEEVLSDYLGLVSQRLPARLLSAKRLRLRQGKCILRVVMYWRLLVFTRQLQR